MVGFAVPLYPVAWIIEISITGRPMSSPASSTPRAPTPGPSAPSKLRPRRLRPRNRSPHWPPNRPPAPELSRAYRAARLRGPDDSGNRLYSGVRYMSRVGKQSSAGTRVLATCLSLGDARALETWHGPCGPCPCWAHCAGGPWRCGGGCSGMRRSSGGACPLPVRSSQRASGGPLGTHWRPQAFQVGMSNPVLASMVSPRCRAQPRSARPQPRWRGPRR